MNMNLRTWTMIGITIATLATPSPALQAQAADAKLQALFKTVSGGAFPPATDRRHRLGRPSL